MVFYIFAHEVFAMSKNVRTVNVSTNDFNFKKKSFLHKIWASYEQAKTLQLTFSFSRRYLIEKFEFAITFVKSKKLVKSFLVVEK